MRPTSRTTPVTGSVSRRRQVPPAAKATAITAGTGVLRPPAVRVALEAAASGVAALGMTVLGVVALGVAALGMTVLASILPMLGVLGQPGEPEASVASPGGLAAGQGLAAKAAAASWSMGAMTLMWTLRPGER